MLNKYSLEQTRGTLTYAAFDLVAVARFVLPTGGNESVFCVGAFFLTGAFFAAGALAIKDEP